MNHCVLRIAKKCVDQQFAIAVLIIVFLMFNFDWNSKSERPLMNSAPERHSFANLRAEFKKRNRQETSNQMKATTMPNTEPAQYIPSDFTNKLQINQKRLCDKKENEHNFIVFLINSHHNNLLRRQAMRNTWLKFNSFRLADFMDCEEIQDFEKRFAFNQNDKFYVKHLFIVGKLNNSDNDEIKREAKKFKDLLVLNENDNYRNIVRKHLALISWTVKYCSNAIYLVKLDDDVFVNIKQLIEHLLHKPHLTENYLYCNHLNNSTPIRSVASKWFVDKKTYSKPFYPTYCEGYAYITNVATMRLINEQYRACKVPIFWIDDLYVTGMLLDGLNHVKRDSFEKSYHNQSEIGTIRTEKLFTWSIHHVNKIHKSCLSYYLNFTFIIIHSHQEGIDADYNHTNTLALLNANNFRERESCEVQLKHSIRRKMNFRPCFQSLKEMFDFYFLKFSYGLWKESLNEANK